MKVVIEIKGTPKDNSILVYNAKLGVYEPILKSVLLNDLTQENKVLRGEIVRLERMIRKGFENVGKELTKQNKLLKTYTEEV